MKMEFIGRVNLCLYHLLSPFIYLYMVKVEKKDPIESTFGLSTQNISYFGIYIPPFQFSHKIMRAENFSEVCLKHVSEEAE